jgi:membrane associated rhomboid family serine protease
MSSDGTNRPRSRSATPTGDVIFTSRFEPVGVVLPGGRDTPSPPLATSNNGGASRPKSGGPLRLSRGPSASSSRPSSAGRPPLSPPVPLAGAAARLAREVGENGGGTGESSARAHLRPTSAPTSSAAAAAARPSLPEGFLKDEDGCIVAVYEEGDEPRAPETSRQARPPSALGQSASPPLPHATTGDGKSPDRGGWVGGGLVTAADYGDVVVDDPELLAAIRAADEADEAERRELMRLAAGAGGNGGSGGSGGGLGLQTAADAELARQLQAAIIDERNRQLQQDILSGSLDPRRRGGGAAAAPSTAMAAGVSVDDPVWGRWERAGDPTGKPVPPHIILCLSCCPCLVPPLCSPERRRAWRRVVFGTLSFFFSLVQLAVVVASLSTSRGLAPRNANSMLGPWPDTLDYLGAKNSPKIVTNLEAWRLVSPLFLHAGLIHLLTNLLVQLRLGVLLEVQWGWRLWVLVYILSGIGGCVASAALKPDSIGVGASGALLGLMGAWIAQLVTEWGQPAAPRPAARVGGGSVVSSAHTTTTRAVRPPTSDENAEAQEQRVSHLVLAVLNVSVIAALSFAPTTDWAAHGGGLISGLLLGSWAFRLPSPPPGDPAATRALLFRTALPAGALVLYVGLLSLGLYSLYSGLVPLNDLLLDVCGLQIDEFKNGAPRDCDRGGF